ncbi:hypothetical protein DH2020_016902 [Rehmannia glutinosa]|uniref:glycerophosphodiester phosphodiesterase n=1 Tax=Rehmannia glutinosa TaxID=99300 RepID=A0ABR0WPL1_REHGL
MWKLRSICCLFWLLLFCSSAALVAVQGSRSRGSKWRTLSVDIGFHSSSGVLIVKLNCYKEPFFNVERFLIPRNAPMVIARGGFSGVFPDSSYYAYKLAVQTGLPNLHVWCDVQLTKDGVGICFPDIRLDNASNINNVSKNTYNTYTVNGVPVQGWFSVDFTLNDLQNVNLRTSERENLTGQSALVGLHDAFFSQHNLSMRSFIISVSRRVIVNFISSPEVGFLRRVVSRFRTSPTKLIFQFLGPDDVELSTNQTYSSLIKNLTTIKSFATGILVPKNYIWPVDNSLYLQNYSSLVLDAHKAGLEVFAFNFVNDASFPYNYSYDPVAEYLSFIDNGQFSVDGVLSDFPVTPSATKIASRIWAKMRHDKAIVTISLPKSAKLLIISSEGASGDYPGCTDKAYAKAVSDGVDILDCPVQMTNDGIPFCLGSINLRDKTNAAQSEFSNLATTNPDLNIKDGIFTYNLTWSQIQMLKPDICMLPVIIRPSAAATSNPYSDFSLFRNPRARNDGNLMQLSDFLAFANNASSVSGVLISIENAAYLAEKQGLDVTNAVLDALSKAGYNNQTAKKVMIKSSDSAVLSKFKSGGNYELVYLVDEDVRDILNSTILEIKKFANSAVISKNSVFPTDAGFLTGETAIVPKLQSFNLTVYVQFFRNEFVSQPWDFLSDPYVEINTHAYYMGIDGVITDYPATAAKFKRNRCLGYKTPPYYMSPVKPGGLIPLMENLFFPPPQAPNPILTENDVGEPPLPPIMERSPSVNGSTAPGPIRPSGQSTLVASTILSTIGILLASFLC